MAANSFASRIKNYFSPSIEYILGKEKIGRLSDKQKTSLFWWSINYHIKMFSLTMIPIMIGVVIGLICMTGLMNGRKPFYKFPPPSEQRLAPIKTNDIQPKDIIAGAVGVGLGVGILSFGVRYSARWKMASVSDRVEKMLRTGRER